MTTILQINSGVTADFDTDWSDFKTWIDGTQACLPYIWSDIGSHYDVIATDGPIHRYVRINKAVSSSADQLDFEQNFKNTSKVRIDHRTSDGAQIVSQTPYAFTSEHTRFVGHFYSCMPGLTVHEELVTSGIRLQSGTYWAQGATAGDYVSFAIVDVDDILNLGPGVTVNEYVKCLPVAPWNHHTEIVSPAAGTVQAGLYLRITYMNTGATPVQLGVTYRWYEPPVT